MRLFLLLILCSFRLVAESNYVYPLTSFDKDLLKERRNKIINSLGKDQLFLAFSADFYQTHLNDDNTFRQSSNFLYLTGNPHQNSILMLSKKGINVDNQIYNEVLFIKVQSKNDIIWNSPMMTIDFATNKLAFKKVINESEFIKIINSNIEEVNELVFAIYTKADYTKKAGKISFEADLPILYKLYEDNPNIKVSVPKEPLTSMREVKDSYEISMIQKAIDISIAGHKNTIQKIRNLKYEYEIEAEMEYSFRFYGAQNTGYNSITGAGVNSCYLHYNSNQQRIPQNSLILMDCGAEYNGYTADITRTVPQNGKFSKEQKIIYEIVLAAADSAFEYARKGNKFKTVDSIAKDVVYKGLIQIGLIENKTEIEKYFMHGTSHYLGLDVHDPGNYGSLQPGNVITIEPGIYIKEGSNCDPKWWNIGVRIEDDILITYQNPINLSKDLARTIDEIEALIK